MTRPGTLESHYAIAYDWLAANGVDEWLPENPIIEVSPTTLSYTAFQWKGPRGWDSAHVRVVDTGPGPEVGQEWRTVPLVSPATGLVLDALRRSGASVEFVDDPQDGAVAGTDLDSRRKRLVG